MKKSVRCDCGFCKNPRRGCAVSVLVVISVIAAVAVISWMLAR